MKQIAAENEIIRFVNGSKLYGNDHAESDDDAIAIFIEPPEYVFSKRKIETSLLHDRSPQAKSQAGEVDGVSYSLRHFNSLALGGNPAILTVLFAPDQFWLYETPEGRKLLENSELYVSMEAAPRFKGYLKNQYDRFTGVRSGHIPNRPELVAKYGYDVKYCMSVARLAYQGIEYFQTGTIVSPMKSDMINHLRAIREGWYTYDEAVEVLEKLEKRLYKAIEASDLPEHPQYDKVYELSRELHESWWSK